MWANTRSQRCGSNSPTVGCRGRCTTAGVSMSPHSHYFAAYVYSFAHIFCAGGIQRLTVSHKQADSCCHPPVRAVSPNRALLPCRLPEPRVMGAGRDCAEGFLPILLDIYRFFCRVFERLLPLCSIAPFRPHAFLDSIQYS